MKAISELLFISIKYYYKRLRGFDQWQATHLINGQALSSSYPFPIAA
ncbi:MAG: hypothetical protein RLZZ419_1781 [Pseudomonadota bacterium]